MSGGVHVAWSFWLPETFKNVRDAKLSDNVVPMPQYGDQFWILNTSMSERILIQRATSTGLPQRASRICASVVTARCFFFFFKLEFPWTRVLWGLVKFWTRTVAAFLLCHERYLCSSCVFWTLSREFTALACLVPSKMIHVVRGEIVENAGDCQTGSCMARSMDENRYSRSKSWKAGVGKREHTSSTMLGDWKEFTFSNQMISKTREKNGNTCGGRHSLQEKSSTWHHESVCTIGDCTREDSPKTVHGCIVESDESTRQRVESPQL